MGQLLAELDALVDGAGGGIDDAPFEFVPTIVSVEAIETIDIVEVAPETGLGASNYSIRFAPKGELYGTGNEPLALFRALQQLGDLTVQADVESVPLLSDFDPSEPRLRWTLTLATEATREEIEAVFEFVADVAELGIEALPRPRKTAGMEATRRRIEHMPTRHLSGTRHSRSPVTPPPAADIDETHATEATSEPAADEPQAGLPEPARSAGPGSPSATPSSAAAPATIRVNLDRVDRLINLIGELVIMEAMLSQAIESAGLASDSDVSNGLDGIKQLASGIQESVMAIRAQPLKPVFQRMHRIIREAADATGKQVRLVHGGRDHGGRTRRSSKDLSIL